MDKDILGRLTNARVRVVRLAQKISSLEAQKHQMNEKGYCVADVVTCGKKGKKALGSVLIKGFPYLAYDKLLTSLEERKKKLNTEIVELEAMVAQAEEFIASVDDIEMRNLLDLHYIDNLTWVRVAHRMNGLYNGKRMYTEDSCRHKFERFMDKK